MYIEKMNATVIRGFLRQIEKPLFVGNPDIRINQVGSKIQVTISNRSIKRFVSIVLKDFSASSHSKEWANYLSRIYGIPYRRAYERKTGRCLN